MPTAERAGMVAALREALETLPAVVVALPRARLDAAPAPGAWSARDVLGHLADAEQVYGARLRMLVTQPRPFLASYDRDAWARRFARLESVESALERWTVLRRANLAVIEALGDDEWLRPGDHEEGMQIGRVETPVGRSPRRLVIGLRPSRSKEYRRSRALGGVQHVTPTQIQLHTPECAAPNPLELVDVPFRRAV